MKAYKVGVDIGGTKCAISLWEENKPIKLKREEFPTKRLTPFEVINKYFCYIDEWIKEYSITSFGISVGGPLNEEKGLIMSPPNLVGWDNIQIVKSFKDRYNIPCYLKNDADASAVAEWKYGAGKGYNNVVFITFGTGFGAGLILNGKPYRGANKNAGEIGHVRLSKQGPIGYNKKGSVEGFCSGGGISKLYYILAKKLNLPAKPNATTKIIADLCREGDKLAKKTFEISGKKLGETLSLIIDILNPEIIILGGVFMRSKDLLMPHAEKVIKKEALLQNYSVCKIVGANLYEEIGDYSSYVASFGDF